MGGRLMLEPAQSFAGGNVLEDGSMPLPPELEQWLDTHADALDQGTGPADELLTMLADAGIYRWGVPAELGGVADTGFAEMVQAIAALASRSMTAAFVSWSQRIFIEFLVVTPNRALARRWLPDLLSGRLAGASGLSNAMKFLGGIEELQIRGTEASPHWRLQGKMPWVSNLRPRGYLVAVALTAPDGGMAVVALPHDAPGLTRSADLALLGLQDSFTAAIHLENTPFESEWLLHGDARQFLPGLRPMFVGLQCGLAIGLARRSLQMAAGSGHDRAAREVLIEPVQALQKQLATLTAQLIDGVESGRMIGAPVELFEIRIALTDVVAQAIQFELQSSGGAAYLQSRQRGFARRLRESAFLPVVTPSLLQLNTELAKRQAKATLGEVK
jgi:alkylation response protein AidB-like acyl-CoA dehydrogenase